MRGRTLVVAALAATVVMAPASPAAAETWPGHGYVTKKTTLPTTNAEAHALGRDIDGDGERDNVVGKVLAALSPQGLDVNTAMADAIESGRILMLHSLRTSSLANSRDATWQVRYGKPKSNPDFSGSGSFVAPAGAPHSLRLDATIKDHVVKTQAGTIPVRLDIGAGTFLLTLRKAKIVAKCYRGRCSNGVITGGVTATQIDGVFIPELAQLMQALVAGDCPGPGPDSCTPGSTGETVQELFDTNDDLVITEDEVRNHPIVQAILAPDLDFYDADGYAGTDGVDDAISFGFGFAAVRARLVRP
jgi:hypothetical protein